MDGGSVDIRVDLDLVRLRRDVAAAKAEIRSVGNVSVRGQFDPLLRDVQAMKQRAAGLSGQLAGMDVATKRSAASAGVLAGGLSTLALRAGVWAAAVGLSIRELDQFSDGLDRTDKRARAAGVELHGVAGAVAEVNRGFRGWLSSELDHLGQAVGYERERLRLAKERVAWTQREFNMVNTDYGPLYVPFKGSPDDRAGLHGPGLAQTIGGIPQTPSFGLSPRLRAAVDIAYTTPGTADEIAQLRRARKALQGQLSGGGLHTDVARSAVAQDLRSVQDQIAALTAKKPGNAAAVRELALENRRARAALTERTSDDVAAVKAQIDYYRSVVEHTKGLAREQARAQEIAKQAELKTLVAAQTTTASVDAAGVLGQLGQGPFLTSPVAQFAQQYGYRPGAGDYLRDIRSQVQAGVRLDRNLGVLRKRGLGDTAVAELAGQGLGGADMVAALAKAPQALIRQYGRAAERREDIAARVQTITATVQTANIIIRNGTVKGIDRNGDGAVNAKDKTAAKLRGV